MALLPIVKHPNEVLRRKAKPVQKINAQVRQLLDDMAETMYDAPGIGLAAPQVGVSKRIVVMDCGEPHGLIEMINPEILQTRGREVGNEGCLSIPGTYGDVDRHAWVRVTALDRQGRRYWLEADGLLARCIQHEIDHLDGVLFIDKAIRLFEVNPEEAQQAAGGGEGE